MTTKATKMVLWDEEARDNAIRFLSALKLDSGRPWQVVLKRYYESPSERQRGYYRSTVLTALSEYTGYTIDEMHAWCLKKFGTQARIEVNGEAFDVSMMTTSNKGELAVMSAFMGSIIHWAASELGVYIPPPRNQEK